MRFKDWAFETKKIMILSLLLSTICKKYCDKHQRYLMKKLNSFNRLFKVLKKDYLKLLSSFHFLIKWETNLRKKLKAWKNQKQSLSEKRIRFSMSLRIQRRNWLSYDYFTKNLKSWVKNIIWWFLNLRSK